MVCVCVCFLAWSLVLPCQTPTFFILLNISVSFPFTSIVLLRFFPPSLSLVTRRKFSVYTIYEELRYICLPASTGTGTELLILFDFSFVFSPEGAYSFLQYNPITYDDAIFSTHKYANAWPHENQCFSIENYRSKAGQHKCHKKKEKKKRRKGQKKVSPCDSETARHTYRSIDAFTASQFQSNSLLFSPV